MNNLYSLPKELLIEQIIPNLESNLKDEIKTLKEEIEYLKSINDRCSDDSRSGHGECQYIIYPTIAYNYISF